MLADVVFLVLPTDTRSAVTLAMSESPEAARTGKVDPSALGNVGLSDLERASRSIT